LLHVLLSDDFAELINTVGTVLIWNEASLAWVTVSALLHGGALLSVGVATGLVDGTSLISHVVVVDPSEGVVCLSTVAAKVWGLARDDHLWGDVDIGPCTSSGDLYSIGQSRGGSLSPTGTAVLWDMLVLDLGHEVGAFDVVPDPLAWQVIDVLQWLLDHGGNTDA